MYSQVVTPGYKVILSVGGKQYTYTGDGSGMMKLCETGTPQAASAPSGGGGGALPTSLTAQVAAAKADLMTRVTTLKDTDIKLTVAEEVTWNDGSLGCAQPGMMYTMALVPGYRIVLEANGQVYNYHGGKGQPPRLCAQPTGKPRGLSGTTTPGDQTQ